MEKISFQTSSNDQLVSSGRAKKGVKKLKISHSKITEYDNKEFYIKQQHWRKSKTRKQQSLNKRIKLFCINLNSNNNNNKKNEASIGRKKFNLKKSPFAFKSTSASQTTSRTRTKLSERRIHSIKYNHLMKKKTQLKMFLQDFILFMIASLLTTQASFGLAQISSASKFFLSFL